MIFNDKRFNYVFSLINFIYKVGLSLINELWEKIINLFDSIKYLMKFKFFSVWELRKFMLKDNNLSFKIYKKNYWLISKLLRKLFDEFNNFMGNLDEIVRFKKNLILFDFDYIKSFVNILFNYDNE